MDSTTATTRLQTKSWLDTIKRIRWSDKDKNDQITKLRLALVDMKSERNRWRNMSSDLYHVLSNIPAVNRIRMFKYIKSLEKANGIKLDRAIDKQLYKGRKQKCSTSSSGTIKSQTVRRADSLSRPTTSRRTNSRKSTRRK